MHEIGIITANIFHIQRQLFKPMKKTILTILLSLPFVANVYAVADTTVDVPDVGATSVLLGLGFVGIIAARRYFSRSS